MEASTDLAGSTRSSGPWWLLPLGLLALGMVLAAWGCTTAVQRTLPLFTDEPIALGSTVERDLTPGSWAVYANTPLSADAVKVTSPSGAAVAVRSQSAGVNESVTREGREFSVVAKFDTTQTGVHALDITGGDSLPQGSQLLLGPPVFEVFSTTGKAALMIVGGVLLTIAGMVLWYRRTRP